MKEGKKKDSKPPALTKVRQRGRPAESDGADKNALLEIAIMSFAEFGYNGCNIKKLAAAAGVSPSLFYYHFENKEGIWQSALELLVAELSLLLKSTKKLLADADPLSTLKTMNRQFIYFSAKRPEFHQIISYEMGFPSERSEWLINTILKPLHQSSIPLYKELMSLGLIKEMSVANIMSISIGAANIFFTQAYQMQNIYGVDVSDPLVIEHHADIVNEIIFNGISLK